jgi:hypothetical protein
MTPEELTLLQNINNNLGLIVNKLGASELSLEPEIETEEAVKTNAELLLESE